MTQLVMRTLDEATGQFVAAYAVCVAKGRVLVQAMRPEWGEAARRVEAALKTRPDARSQAAENIVQR